MSCCIIKWKSVLFVHCLLTFSGVDPGFAVGGGRQHMILPHFPKNCMKLRKFWAVGEGGGGAPLLLSYCIFLSNFYHFSFSSFIRFFVLLLLWRPLWDLQILENDFWFACLTPAFLRPLTALFWTSDDSTEIFTDKGLLTFPCYY